MRKLLLLVVVILILAWLAQNYTSFKAVDIGKSYLQRVDWSELWTKAKNALPFIGDKIAPADKQLNIFIRENGFTPNFNAMAKGAKVTWFNEDKNIHTVIGDNWNSGQLTPGQTFSKKFDEPGKYSYHCSIHPSEAGELIIE
ncbi:MAG: Blue (Type 1) copper domain protein [Parcubacteria group bacterium GW2011_GWA2_42_11]|nr:MAG: Blue (Type 1) copper domain protein [Parcubacteria group bacterium GW2011_GWA2_42_11]KKT76612.1 MAG: Blue (Type 1) copper domain protein [Parcubacteria group bacterium GW2011_GWF2_44_7]